MWLCFTDDLRRALKSDGPLKTLAETNDDDSWCINESNAKYITQSLLKAIERMESQGVRHGDVKGHL